MWVYQYIKNVNLLFQKLPVKKMAMEELQILINNIEDARDDEESYDQLVNFCRAGLTEKGHQEELIQALADSARTMTGT